jgi:hypothetical protein
MPSSEKPKPSTASNSPRGAALATSPKCNRYAPPVRMTVSAIAPKYGTAGRSRSADTIPNTGPSKILAPTSQTASGIPVLEKTDSPAAPSRINPDTTTNMVLTMSITRSP